eukprot:gene16170-19247_t
MSIGDGRKKKVTFDPVDNVQTIQIVEGERTRFVPCTNTQFRDIIEKYEDQLYANSKLKNGGKREQQQMQSPMQQPPLAKVQLFHIDHLEGEEEEEFDTETMSKEELQEVLQMNDLDDSGTHQQLKHRLEKWIVSGSKTPSPYKKKLRKNVAAKAEDSPMDDFEKKWKQWSKSTIEERSVEQQNLFDAFTTSLTLGGGATGKKKKSMGDSTTSSKLSWKPGCSRGYIVSP